jgi:hypothetical protein
MGGIAKQGSGASHGGKHAPYRGAALISEIVEWVGRGVGFRPGEGQGEIPFGRDRFNPGVPESLWGDPVGWHWPKGWCPCGAKGAGFVLSRSRRRRPLRARWSERRSVVKAGAIWTPGRHVGSFASPRDKQCDVKNSGPAEPLVQPGRCSSRHIVCHAGTQNSQRAAPASISPLP